MPHFFAMKLIEIIKAVHVIVGFAIVGWLSFLHPDWLLWIGAGTIVPGAFLLFVCLTPAGGLKLGSSENKMSGWLWFAKLLKAQLAFLILTVTCFVAFFYDGPSFSQAQFSGTLLVDVIKSYLSQWGVLPWGIYGFWAIVIAYAVYVKKGVPYLYQIDQGLTLKIIEPPLKSYVEGTCHGATMLGLSLCASSIILLFAYAIENSVHLTHFKVPYVTFFVISFLASFFAFKYNRKWLLNKTKGKSTYSRVYLIMIPLTVLFLLGAAWGNNWFIINKAELYQRTLCHQCGNYFANVSIETRFAALYWGWWLIWAPLCGSYLAKISKERTLREFVIGLSIVPLLLSGVYLFWQLRPFDWLLHNAVMTSPSLILVILAVLAWVVFSQIIAGYGRSDLLVSGMMPLPEDMRTSRLWLNEGSKTYSISKFCHRLFMLVISTLFLHSTAGWYGIQLQVTAMAVFVIYAIYWAVIALFTRFFIDKVWINNQNILPFPK